MIPGMMKDKMPGQGVQPWSVGDIYPLVIARVERYIDAEPGAESLWARNVGTYWNVLNADDDMAGFASYDDAYAAAKGWLAADGSEC